MFLLQGEVQIRPGTAQEENPRREPRRKLHRLRVFAQEREGLVQRERAQL